jgi:hypothetical protein
MPFAPAFRDFDGSLWATRDVTNQIRNGAGLDLAGGAHLARDHDAVPSILALQNPAHRPCLARCHAREYFPRASS